MCPALCDPMDCSTPGFPVLHYLPEFAQTHVHLVDDSIKPSYPLSPPSPPALNLSQHQGLFKWVSSLHKWLKYWSFNCRINPSNKYSGLIFFKIGWFDLSVQGTLKSLLQHHSLKASFLWHSVFFMVQLSHPYMTTGKTIGLTIWTFVGKVMSLLYNMLSRFVIAFLPRSKHLLISWLQSLSAVIFWVQENKICHCFHCFPIYLPWSGNRLDAMILVFWMLSFKPTFSLSSFNFIKKLFSSSSLSAIRVVSSAYLRLLIFLPTILIPAYASSSLVFLVIYYA